MRHPLQEKAYLLLILGLTVFLAFLSYFLTPIFFVGGVIGYLITCIVGLGMGWFIAIFMSEIDYLTKHHHASLILVVVVCSSVFFSTINVDYIKAPFINSLIFIVSFITPYLHYHR